MPFVSVHDIISNGAMNRFIDQGVLIEFLETDLGFFREQQTRMSISHGAWLLPGLQEVKAYGR